MPVKDIKGNTYNQLTVIEYIRFDKGVGAIWKCQCICGEFVITARASLEKGLRKSCGCVRKNRLIGERFGRLVVIKAVGSEYAGIMWECICDCGKSIIVSSAELTGGHYKSCGCLKKECAVEWGRDTQTHNKSKGYGVASFNSTYSRYRQQAKTAGREFALNKEQFREITQQNCYYCGCEPNQIARSAKAHGSYIYNGIDRVDSSRGYFIDNVVPCCANCNYAKRHYNQEDFLRWALRLADNIRAKQLLKDQ